MLRSFSISDPKDSIWMTTYYFGDGQIVYYNYTHMLSHIFNTYQYSCLENPLDREARQATVHKIAQSWTWLKWLSMHACTTHTHTHTHTDIHSNLSVSIGGCFPICDAQVPHEWSSRVGPLHLWIQLTLGCGGPALCVCVCVYVCVCMCISWKVNESLLLNKNNNKLSNFSTGLTAERSLI